MLPDNGMCMSEFQVKRIILPSGKAVEIVYLQSAPGVPAVNANDENLVGVHGEADVQRYDALLNDGTDTLIEHVEQLAHDNMAAEIERFVAALRDDHITPFDF